MRLCSGPRETTSHGMKLLRFGNASAAPLSE
jgi:hypothetical protein